MHPPSLSVDRPGSRPMIRKPSSRVNLTQVAGSSTPTVVDSTSPKTFTPAVTGMPICSSTPPLTRTGSTDAGDPKSGSGLTAAVTNINHIAAHALPVSPAESLGECAISSGLASPTSSAQSPFLSSASSSSSVRGSTGKSVDSPACPHLNIVKHTIERILDLGKVQVDGRDDAESENPPMVLVDGNSLDVALLCAISKGQVKMKLAPNMEDQIKASVDILADRLDRGEMVYGVNTGFGGSADVRTTHLANLQMALVQHQNAGILSNLDTGLSSSTVDLEDLVLSMPTSWARGTMAVRLNTLVRGHSAVSVPVIGRLLQLLQHDVVPVIPLRGTVSASGDLCILSYLAGLLQGNSAIYARIGSTSESRRVVTAAVALAELGIEPVRLGPKEGLGLLNGTAASACVGALVIEKVNSLAVLTQAITALNVEALGGSAESFDPFIASVRPHPGQIEAAHNIFTWLEGSKLATRHGDKSLDEKATTTDLAQDRYALRTSPQFVGPVLEDLQLAFRQISTELNSTTDNPLINPADGKVFHGGNFQGMHVSLAMEKARLGCAVFGKLIFAQTTELMNPSMSRGLPPNLAPDDPSTSFIGKGVDIAVAAYCSELAYLANPVVTGIQSAEMHNQSVNSMALVNARYADQAADVLGMLLANAIWAGVQGVDLRVIQHRFFANLETEVSLVLYDSLIAGSKGGLESTGFLLERSLVGLLVEAIKSAWVDGSSLDCSARASSASDRACSLILKLMMENRPTGPALTILVPAVLTKFRLRLGLKLLDMHEEVSEAHARDYLDETPGRLGKMSEKIYRFVRSTLALPFHCGRAHDPVVGVKSDQLEGSVGFGTTGSGLTVGGEVGRIYEAVRSGRLVAEIIWS